MNTPETLQENSAVYNGHFTSSLTCDYLLVVDIMASGTPEPVIIPKVNELGQFSFQIPEDYSRTPLSIHGFCYSNAKNFSINQSSWQTEPYLLLPKDGLKTIVLSRKAQRNEPAIAEVNLSEWSLYVNNPSLVTFYGLRHPDHTQASFGEQPEIRAGGLTVATTRTHLWSIYSVLYNSITTNQRILLPTREDMLTIEKITDRSDPRLIILSAQLKNTCTALEIACPSINHLRSQQWIAKDKTFLPVNHLSQKKAMLWLLAHNLFILSTADGSDASSYLPNFHELSDDPTEKEWIGQIESVLNGYRILNIEHPDWATEWLTAL